MAMLMARKQLLVESRSCCITFLSIFKPLYYRCEYKRSLITGHIVLTCSTRLFAEYCTVHLFCNQVGRSDFSIDLNRMACLTSFNSATD